MRLVVLLASLGLSCWVPAAQAGVPSAQVVFLYPASQRESADQTLGALRDLLADPGIALRDRAVDAPLPAAAEPAKLAALLDGEGATLLVLGEFSPVPSFGFFWRDERGDHLSQRVLPSSVAGPNSRAEALSLIIRSLLESIAPQTTIPGRAARAEPAGWAFAFVSGYRALYVPAGLFTSHAVLIGVEASPGRPFWLGLDLAVHGRTAYSRSDVDLALQPWEVRLRVGLEQITGRLRLGVLLAANVTFWSWRATSDRAGFHPIPRATDQAAGLEGAARLGVRLARFLELVAEVGLQLPLLAQGFTVKESDQSRQELLSVSPINPFGSLGLRLPI